MVKVFVESPVTQLRPESPIIKTSLVSINSVHIILTHPSFRSLQFCGEIIALMGYGAPRKVMAEVRSKGTLSFAI